MADGYLPIPEELPLQFRAAMRRLAASVAIVAARGEHGPVGMAATSVTSLTVDPPAVLICVNRATVLHGLLVPTAPLSVTLVHEAFGQRFAFKQPMKHGDALTVVIDAKQATAGLNGQWAGKPAKGVKLPKSKPLSFAKPGIRSFKKTSISKCGIGTSAKTFSRRCCARCRSSSIV